MHCGNFFVGFTVITQGFLALRIHSGGPSRLVGSKGTTFHTEVLSFSAHIHGNLGKEQNLSKETSKLKT